jgi:hypothetical protein
VIETGTDPGAEVWSSFANLLRRIAGSRRGRKNDTFSRVAYGPTRKGIVDVRNAIDGNARSGRD